MLRFLLNLIRNHLIYIFFIQKANRDPLHTS